MTSNCSQGQGQPEVQDPALMNQEDFFKYYDKFLDSIFESIAKLPYLCYYCCKSCPKEIPKCTVCEKYICPKCCTIPVVKRIPLPIHCPRCAVHALRDLQELVNL